MSQRKIAILGGGIASLTAAYYLTRTPELRAQNHVTLYQLGWRLGGKCASGRSMHPDQGLRIEEHGLHLWFGFYENAFATLQEVYDRRPSRVDDRIVTWRDAMSPNSYTPLGEDYDGQLGYWPFVWPTNLDVPGSGAGVPLTPLGALSQLASIVRRFAGALGATASAPADGHAEGWLERLEAVPLEAELAALGTVLAALERIDETTLALVGNHHRALQAPVDVLRRVLRDLMESRRNDIELRRLYSVFDLGLAMLLGILDPKYGIFSDGDFDLDRIDHLELRAFLLENGGDPCVVNESTYLRALYDLPFAYADGDTSKPGFAAGAALRIILRIVTTYKEACFFQMTAGMGEAVIAPYYEVLREQGVDVRFFRKVRRLELSEDKRWVSRVHLDRQVDLLDVEGDYRPTFRVGGVTCWPSEPFWDQIVDGAAMRERLAKLHMTLESHWCLEKAGEEVLELGTDFDAVVLGIALGAFKKLNAEPTLCDELYEHSPRFRAMAEGIGLVPTQAFQIWTNTDLAGLGFEHILEDPPAMDAAPEPYSVWADASLVLPREAWPRQETAPSPPRGVFYFCGPWQNGLTAVPSSDASVPARALAEVKAEALHWLDHYTGYMWPKAKDPVNPNGLDFAVLYDPAGRDGHARFDFQWIRPNVDPTECCETTLPDTTKLRLKADESGFENLVLAGAWLRTGINATCVEAATMSGMDAARAICGEPREIVGEWFCMKRPERPPRRVP